MTRVFTAVVAAVACAGSAAASTLYGVASFSPFGTQSLYAVDASTGAATLIGSTGLRQVAGLDWDESAGRLVALTVAGDLFELNPATGASSLLVDGAFGVPEGSLVVHSSGTYAPLFDSIHRLEGTTWQPLGASGLPAGADISGLEMVGGRLLGLATFGAAADALVQFDLASGAGTILGLTGTQSGSVGGMANGNALYMSDGSRLYTLNASTGVATLIGAHGVSGMSGLAIPGPSALALLGSGMLLLGARRRAASR